MASVLFLTYAWQFAKASGVNQGIISSLCSASSIIDIVTFYYFFGERTNIAQFIGIGLMMLGLSLISTASSSEINDDLGLHADE